MENLSITDKADRLLTEYVDSQSLGATKKTVGSEAIKRFVEADRDG